MDKFRHKLPKDILKRHAKDVAKSLVKSDYKHNRVENPTTIDERQVKKVKAHVKDFMDRAVVKYRDIEKEKTDREAKNGADKADSPSAGKAVASVETPGPLDGDDDVAMSDVEDAITSSPVKRKRDDDEDGSVPETSLTPNDTPSTKRLKEDNSQEASPPPPPPPPPDATMNGGMSLMAEQVVVLDDGLQDVVNRLASEAEKDRVRQEEALQRENEEAMREFELEQTNQKATAVHNGYHTGSASGTTAENGGDDKQHGYVQRSKQAIPGQ